MPSLEITYKYIEQILKSKQFKKKVSNRDCVISSWENMEAIDEEYVFTAWGRISKKDFFNDINL